MVETVAAAAFELEAAAGSLSHTAETTSEHSATVAAASQQASGNVQAIATAAEELATAVG